MIFFTPHEEDEESTEVRAATYKQSGEKVGGSQMGDSYHIVLFRMDEEDVVIIEEGEEGYVQENVVDEEEVEDRDGEDAYANISGTVVTGTEEGEGDDGP
jgi:hypothetical protein